MITSGDDYPIHQLPQPVAVASGERNFYDRYFFNGYDREATLFFAAALGVYPQLGVMDAAFSVVLEGVQHNLRASSAPARLDRLHTEVGPIRIEVVEPLEHLAVRVVSNAHGVEADLLFAARSRALEEPHFLRRVGGRTLMDYTRMTQNGTWTGHLEVAGRRVHVEPDQVWGTRDRSWGLRAVGAPDPQPVPGVERQFFWLWAPLNFDDAVTLYHTNEDGDGRPWARHARLVPLGEAGSEEEFRDPSCRLRFRRGTRQVSGATLLFPDPRGDVTVELRPRLEFFMSGLGYLHPDWGHGHYRGDLDVTFDQERLDTVDRDDLLHLHVQTLCDAALSMPDGSTKNGQGVLEQLLLGRHEPCGLEAAGPGS